MTTSFKSKDILYRISQKKDDSLLKQILRDNTMPSWVSISTQREPSYFLGATLIEDSYTIVVEHINNLKKSIGMYSCSFMEVHIKGKKQKIGYLGGMRVNPMYQNKIRYIKQGYKAIEKLLPDKSDVPFYFTSIASENIKARRLLEANINGMPKYNPKGEMNTLIFSTKKGKKTTILKQATHEDIPKIVTFYNQQASKYELSPYLSKEWILKMNSTKLLNISDFWFVEEIDGNIECCLAIWDQRSFKQNIIKSYRYPLNYLRYFYNFFAYVTRRVQLPQCGSILNHVFISFFASKKVDISIKALQEAAYIAKEKGVNSCVIGLSSKHLYIDKIKKAFTPSVYNTQIQTVILNAKKDDMFMDEHSIIQPEIALL